MRYLYQTDQQSTLSLEGIAEEEHCPGRSFVEPQLQYKRSMGSSAEVKQR